jgi:hypothetical protein
MHTTKISGLGVDTEYTFHLVLRTTAGTFSSEKIVLRTHKMTDLSGITVTAGILPAQLRESLAKAVDRIGAKIADTVRIDTTHFVTTEGRGLAWEKAVELNIPVVRPEWVEGCERGGRIVGVRQYYLDADPRQRQVVQIQPESEASNETAVPESANNGAKGSASQQGVPPTPPAKDQPKEEEDDSEEDEDEETNQIADEQKVRVEDRDQHKVALRPAESAEPSTEPEVKEEAVPEDDSGAATPGNSSFQDVDL